MLTQVVLSDIVLGLPQVREELLSSILSTAHDAIIAIDDEQKIIVFNEGAQRMFGYEVDEVIGCSLDILLPQVLQAKHRTHIQNFANSHINTRMMGERKEISGQRKDGSIFPAEGSISKLAIDGQIIFTVILRDVTERKLLEQAVRESEARFRAMTENSADGILLLDKDGFITYSSRGISTMLGYSSSDYIGRKPFEFVHPDHLDESLKNFSKLLQTHGQEFISQPLIRHRNGDWVWIELRAVNLLKDPEIKGIVVNFRNITERKQAEKHIKTQLQRLSGLRAIDIAIAGTLDIRLSLNVVLDQTISQLGVDAADILLITPPTQTLTFAAGKGFRTESLRQGKIQLGEGQIGQAALERQLVYISDLRERKEAFPRWRYIENEGFVAYYAAPLISKGNVFGVLEVFRRSPFEGDNEWRSYLETLAGQAGIAVENARLFENLQRSNLDLSMAYDATIEGWSRALDLRDRETEGHTQRVTSMTLELARTFNLSEDELTQIRWGALLHDIGKMGVPDSILLKPGPLTAEEWTIMKKHPEFAYEMLSPIQHLRKALEIPYHHHEKWDGTGYPLGLKGEQIPLAARIFAVVDVWDALRSDRPYRAAWPAEKVYEHIQSLSGTHFDPRAAKAFLASDIHRGT